MSLSKQSPGQTEPAETESRPATVLDSFVGDIALALASLQPQARHFNEAFRKTYGSNEGIDMDAYTKLALLQSELLMRGKP